MPVFRMDTDQYGKQYIKEYIYRSSRGQYAGEGYIFSFLAFTISMAFLFMIKGDRFFETNNSKRIAMFVAVVVLFSAVQVYILCYKIKTPWYSNNFWPPENFLKGPIMRDQGNNI